MAPDGAEVEVVAAGAEGEHTDEHAGESAAGASGESCHFHAGVE